VRADPTDGGIVFLRIDRLQTELPPPSDADPAGAAAVQELLGGKFGEMSTWLDYTFQSFNFCSRQGARAFYDLLCSIGTEEFGHVELVSATVSTMLTGASPTDDGRAPEAGLADMKGIGNPHHSSPAGRARCRRTRRGARGTATTSSRPATWSRI
jgi:Mn-containing catalase